MRALLGTAAHFGKVVVLKLVRVLAREQPLRASGRRFRAKREQLEKFSELLPESHGSRAHLDIEVQREALEEAEVDRGAHLLPSKGAASERRGNTLKRFKDVYLKAKAII